MELSEIRAALDAKGSGVRFRAYVDLLNEAMLRAEPLFDTGSLEGDCDECWYLVRHAEFLWDDAVLLLEQGTRASATFLAIVAIEEMGKVSIGRFQVAANEALRQRERPVEPAPKKRGPLFSHHKKHQMAAFAGLAVNSRADRILGLENVCRLLELAAAGGIEAIRQNALYSRREGGMVSLPMQSLSDGDALFFCTVAGELLAEIGGLAPKEFVRLSERVDAFEARHPLGDYVFGLGGLTSAST